MKINFPITCERDSDTVLAIIAPNLFDIEYACPEARELYSSLTNKDKEEIKEYVRQLKKRA